MNSRAPILSRPNDQLSAQRISHPQPRRLPGSNMAGARCVRTAGVDQQVSQTAFAKRPVSYGSGIDMDETRSRIPAHTAPPHRSGGAHRLGEIGCDVKIDRSPIDVLAMLGDTERGTTEHRVRLGGSIG